MAIYCGEASKMLARILDEALDTQATPSNNEDQQTLPEPGPDGAVPGSVDNDTFINSSGNEMKHCQWTVKLFSIG